MKIFKLVTSPISKPYFLKNTNPLSKPEGEYIEACQAQTSSSIVNFSKSLNSSKTSSGV